MGRRLIGTVPIHQEDGTVKWYGPDDKVPASVAKQIGDHAWVEDDEDAVEPPVPPTPAPSGATPPPLSGAGSGAEAWAEYAAKLGVSLPDGSTKRDDIVAAVRAAGYPVEQPAD
jgi:hypothetical protein